MAHTIEEQVYKVTGKAFAQLVKAARRYSDKADEQRMFLNLCIEQLFTDVRNC